MKRPVCKTTPARHSVRSAAGYTMVEILVATALMLTIMLGVAWVFGMVGETIADSRSTLEMTGQLRGVAARLKQELDGVTVTMLPPRDPASNEGYFEITEGAIGPVIPRQVASEPYGVARNIDRPRAATASDAIPYEVDTTVGDTDDILMFTTRGSGEPFVGRIVTRVDPVVAGLPVSGQDDWDDDGTVDNDYAYVPNVIQADVAEVAYFVRDGTLYRRQLLVRPDFPQIDLDDRNPGFQTLAAMSYAKQGFYNNDVSIRQEWLCTSVSPPSWDQVMAANTLGDLTKRENRFAHRPRVPASGAAAGFPYHPHWWYDQGAGLAKQTGWATFVDSTTAPYLSPGLGLPTLEECSHPTWEAAGLLPNPVVNTSLTPTAYPYDAWVNPHPYAELDQDTGSMVAYTGHVLPRVGEDVVLTNVVGFDVKVWDPLAWVLPGIDAAGTPTDLTAANYWTSADFNDNVIPGTAVVPGDPGYELALAHALVAIDTGLPAQNLFRPVGYGAYVDLNYMASMNINGSPATPAMAALKLRLLNLTAFSGPGEYRSQLKRVYDTWSTHYESNWLDSNLNGVKDSVAPNPDLGDENRNGSWDEGTDGLDNPPVNGVVDDALEQEAPAPYPVPLRGIQIKIRVFDPDSRQVRERTIISDFLPK